jgi:hypothetical protein
MAAGYESAALGDGGTAAPATELADTLERLDSVLLLLEGYDADLVRADATMLYMSAGDRDTAIQRAAEITNPEVQSFALQRVARADIAAGGLSQAAALAGQIKKDVCLVDVALWLADGHRTDLALVLIREIIKDDRLRALGLLQTAAAEKRFGNIESADRILGEIEQAQLERAFEHPFCASRIAVAFGVLGVRQRLEDVLDRFAQKEGSAIERFAKIAENLADYEQTDLAISVARRTDPKRRAPVLIAIGRALLRQRAFAEIRELERDAAMTEEALNVIQPELIHAKVSDGDFGGAVAELRTIPGARAAASAAADIAVGLVLRERYDEAVEIIGFGTRKAELVQDPAAAIECNGQLARSLALSGRAGDAVKLVEKAKAALKGALADIVSSEDTAAVESLAVAEMAVGNRSQAVEVLTLALEEASRQAEDMSLLGAGEAVWAVALIRRLVQIGEHERARACATADHSYPHTVLGAFIEEVAARVDAPQNLALIEAETDPVKRAGLLAAKARGLLRKFGRPWGAPWTNFGLREAAM